MATKRKILLEKEIEGEVERKMARMEDDRLSNLPKDLQVRILTFLDLKEAVKTSVLSKTWVSLWTLIPVLEFYGYHISNLYVFDKLVNRVLCLRDRSAKLDRLLFTRRGTSSATILNNVFDYAFSHGVKNLEAHILHSRNHGWPVCPDASFESLTSLKLVSENRISCPFLGPRSGSFKNLTDLYLTRTIITDLEPFSGFPVLERLTLLNCDISTEGETLSVHARNLLDLTISGYQSYNWCELTTPRLRFFGYRGGNFPLIRTHEGLPFLDTIAIDFNGDYHHIHEKRTFDDLVKLLCAFPNATSLTLFSDIVHLLSFFPDELVEQRSPFRNLNCLKLDLRYLQCQNDYGRPRKPDKPFQIPSDVKAYLFNNSPNAEVIILYSVDFWDDAEDFFDSRDIF